MKGKAYYSLADELFKKYYKESSLEKREILYRKYMKFIKLSAEGGNADAQFTLAGNFDHPYFFSKSPEYNLKLARFWYQKAAD